MNTFKLQWSLTLLCILITFLSLETSEGTFLSGWILPNPSEVVIIGLFFLKIIGLQLAVAHGLLMPPHNPFFGKRSISENHHQSRYSKHPKTANKISMAEFKTIERVLLSLRRIDSKDCFLRSVCEMNQDILVNDRNNKTENVEKLLQVFRLQKLLGIKSDKANKIWDIYEEATRPEEINCFKKYPACPLTKKELGIDIKLGTSLKSFS